MELRCPECCSPEVEPDPEGAAGARRCGSCGARFAHDSALVALADAIAPREDPAAQKPFTFNWVLAEAEFAKLDAAIPTVSPFSDADELGALLDAAQEKKIVEAEHSRARLYVFPQSLDDPGPLLAVDPGKGPTLLGHPLKLRQDEGEDPISFTMRVLVDAVDEANGLVGGWAELREGGRRALAD